MSNISFLQQAVEDLSLRVVREMHLTTDAEKLVIGAFKNLQEALTQTEKIVIDALQTRNRALASALGKELVEPATIEHASSDKKPRVVAVKD